MRGIDGNYLNTQGDALAKMQTVYQAEQNRQQAQAQVEATETLRKLREQVNETEKNTASGRQREVQEDGRGSGGFTRDESAPGEKEKRVSMTDADAGFKVEPVKTHIDIRA